MSTHVAKHKQYSAMCDCGWSHGFWTNKTKAKYVRDYHSDYCPENNTAYVVER